MQDGLTFDFHSTTYLHDRLFCAGRYLIRCFHLRGNKCKSNACLYQLHSQGGSWYVKDTGELWQGASSLGQRPPSENYYDPSSQASFSSFPEDNYLTAFGNQPSQHLAQTLLGRYAEDVLFVTLLTTLAFTILLSIVVVGMAVVICKLKSQVIEKEKQKNFTEVAKNNSEDILPQFDELTATVNERLANVRTLLEPKPGTALQMMNKKQEQPTFPKPAERNNVS